MTPKQRAKKYVPDHPLATAGGSVAVARLVLFDELGYGPHRCVWCGLPLQWRGPGSHALCADHVDGDSLNDTPENLVASCRGCNANRTDGTGYGRSQPRPCENCGKTMNPSAYKTTHWLTRRFCSNSCSARAKAALRPPRSLNHGTRSEYVFGCRCKECRDANAAYARRSRLERRSESAHCHGWRP